MADSNKARDAGESTRPTGAEPGTLVTPQLATARPAERRDFMEVLNSSTAWVSLTDGVALEGKNNELTGDEKMDRKTASRLYLLARSVLEANGYLVDPGSGYSPRLVVRVLEA